MAVELNKVLECVNKARAALGKDPLDKMPKGYIGSATLCPIAQAFDCEATACDMLVTFEDTEDAKKVAKAWSRRCNKYGEIGVPIIIRQFIDEFDERLFPELA